MVGVFLATFTRLPELSEAPCRPNASHNSNIRSMLGKLATLDNDPACWLIHELPFYCLVPQRHQGFMMVPLDRGEVLRTSELTIRM